MESKKHEIRKGILIAKIVCGVFILGVLAVGMLRVVHVEKLANTGDQWESVKVYDIPANSSQVIEMDVTAPTTLLSSVSLTFGTYDNGTVDENVNCTIIDKSGKELGKGSIVKVPDNSPAIIPFAEKVKLTQGEHYTLSFKVSGKSKVGLSLGNPKGNNYPMTMKIAGNKDSLIPQLNLYEMTSSRPFLFDGVLTLFIYLFFVVLVPTRKTEHPATENIDDETSGSEVQK